MAITVNGTEYASWDDVPEDVRATLRGALPDADGDGVPDVLQGRGAPGQHVVRTMKIKVGDQEYDSPDQLPPELRASLQSAGLFPTRPALQPGVQASPEPAPQAGAQTGPQPGPRPAPGFSPPAAPIPPPVSTAPAAGPVMLNGVPVDAQVKKKHWWQRG